MVAVRPLKDLPPTCWPFIIPKTSEKVSLILSCVKQNKMDGCTPPRFSLRSWEQLRKRLVIFFLGVPLYGTHIDLKNAFWSFVLPESATTLLRLRSGPSGPVVGLGRLPFGLNMCMPTHSPLPPGRGPPARTVSTSLGSRTLPILCNAGRTGIAAQTSGPHTRPAAVTPVDHTSLHNKHYTPRETPQNLRNMVGAPSGKSRKRKLSNEHAQPAMDVDTWLQEARHTNDTEAVRWFTRTILHQTTTTAHWCKRPRSLNMLHNRWTTALTCMEDLICRHLCATTHAYKYASTCAHAMKRLRELRSLYDSALTYL